MCACAVLNASSTVENNSIKPISLVCDSSILHAIQPILSKLLPASSPLIDLTDWLNSDNVVDMVVCTAAAGLDLIQAIRQQDNDVYLVVVIDDLRDANVGTILSSGANDIISTAELNTGRLDLMILNRFRVGCSNDSYFGHHTLVKKNRQELLCHAKFLHNLLDSVPQLIFAKNAKLDFIYSNRAAIDFNGLGPKGMDKLGMRELNLQEEQSAAIETVEQNLIVSGTEEIIYNFEKTDQHGDLRILQTQKIPMAIFGQKADTLSLIYTDVTDLDSADRALAAERLALEMRDNFISALSDVSMQLLESKSIDQLMDNVAKQAASLSNSKSAFVSIVHESGQYMEILGATGRFLDFKGFQHIKGDDVAGLAWDLEELVLMEGKSSENGVVELWGDSIKRCAVPFFIENQFAGVVCVALDPVGASLANHLDILKLFTRTVSISIENSLLINNQKEELVRHIAVGEITQSFYSAANLRELIDSVCKSLLGVFESKHITVCKINKDEKFVLLAEWQNDNDGVRRASYSNVKMMSDSIAKWCVDNKQCAMVPRGVEDERDSTAVNRIRKLLGIGCTITIPLIQDGVVWGVISMGKDADQKNYTDVELSLLELLASQLSSSVMRQNLLDKIHFQAFHDSLTKLPNRLKFENTLSRLVTLEDAKQEKFALLFLDLDGFKSVNDNQGHTVGDELLKSVSQRLAGCLHEKDLLARMGGDEFAVLLRGVKSQESAHAIALRLSNAIGQKFTIGQYNLKIGVSVGVSFFPENGKTVDDLLRNADFAMYEAKAEGNSSVRSFNQNMAVQFRNRVALENDLLHAIENKQFELHYQPKVNLAEGLVSGVEALLRWNHPELGYVSPGEFVPIAEEAGYITELGKWVFEEAVRQKAEWVESGLCELTMAVNISAPQFAQDDFFESIMKTLTAYKLHPNQLELEVTESVVMNNVSKVISTLNEIRGAGVSVAVDDFGTGYSSLAYLENLPLDCLKIDKIFVDKLGTGDDENSLVNTILTLARSSGLHTVAEGVENKEQVWKLIDLGCECIQGFYFSKPVPAAQIPSVIASIEGEFHEVRKAG